MSADLRSPFPWFGGKARVASLVWERFGSVRNYVEPFFGSGAVLLQRPEPDGTETVNDADGYVANFWRALQHDPDIVCHYASGPVNEADLHARHVWLLQRRGELLERLCADPYCYDPRIAGWWVWGQSIWIAGGWCDKRGSWWPDENGLLAQGNGGVCRQRPHLGDAGRGVKRQRPHLGNAGTGVKRQGSLLDYLHGLADRLAAVRVCCGDWSRVCGPSVTYKHGTTAVFLDPPYSAEADRDMGCYSTDSGTVAHDVRAWCLENGDNPLLRIALCGYDTEHEVLEDQGWECLDWSTSGGYSSQGKGRAANRHRERIWFSAACLSGRQFRSADIPGQEVLF